MAGAFAGVSDFGASDFVVRLAVAVPDPLIVTETMTGAAVTVVVTVTAPSLACSLVVEDEPVVPPEVLAEAVTVGGVVSSAAADACPPEVKSAASAPTKSPKVTMRAVRIPRRNVLIAYSIITLEDNERASWNVRLAAPNGPQRARSAARWMEGNRHPLQGSEHAQPAPSLPVASK